MDNGGITNGKYKKLTAREKEKIYLQNHPVQSALSVDALPLSKEEAELHQTCWRAGQTNNQFKKSCSLEDEKRKTVDLSTTGIASSSSSLVDIPKAHKLNKSDPQLSFLSADLQGEPLKLSSTPPASPRSSGLVSLRVKEKKFSSPLHRRGNKASSVYGDISNQVTSKKQRPRSGIFANSVMRRPRNSLTNSPMSLLDTLETKKMKTAFLDFLESEYSSENLCFWLSCEKFRKIKGEEHRNKEGRIIYSQYICPNAPHQINIDHVTRRQVTIELTTCDVVASDVFDNAQRYVFSIMENDSFPRFINSSFYKEATVSKKNTFETVIANILPGSWNSGSTSPTKTQNKLKHNTNNNNSKVIYSDNEQPKPTATVFRRFSFGLKKNYATKPKKQHRSSAPDLSSNDFFNVEVKVE